MSRNLRVLLRVFILAGLFAGFVIPTQARAQNGQAASGGGLRLQAALRTLLTEAEKAAVGLTIDLFKNPRDVFVTNCGVAGRITERCNTGRETGWLFDLAPDVRINTGSDDAFQSIVAKATGSFMLFRLSSPADQGLPPDLPQTPIPDLRSPVHVFPLSFGVETTRHFDTVAGIAEIGYVPFVLQGGSIGGVPFQLGVKHRFGVFLQGGYKFNNATKARTGGAKDESSEPADDGIGRIKAVAAFPFSFPVSAGSLGARILFSPEATAWYDFLHNALYYAAKLSAGLVLIETDGKERTLLDFTIEHGSGEPNFNTGTQFSTGLKVVF